MARPRITEQEAILDAAARRLAAHGVAATTVDDVALEAGVSRATVYRYSGGKDEIVRAVIAREAEQLLARLASVVTTSPTLERLIADLVATAATAIAVSPVLARLSGEDVRDTLPFITIDSASLVDAVAGALAAMIGEAPQFALEPAPVALAVEEATRLVLTHLTTPRRDGSRAGPDDLGAPAATMIVPLLGQPAGRA